MRPAASPISAWIDLRALALASGVGGALLWMQQMASLSKPFESTLFPVLLAPVLALASAIAILLMIVPPWLLLRRTPSGRPLRFALMAGFGWFAFVMMLRIGTGMLVEESFPGLGLFAAWVSIVAFVYTRIDERRSRALASDKDSGI